MIISRSNTNYSEGHYKLMVFLHIVIIIQTDPWVFFFKLLSFFMWPFQVFKDKHIIWFVFEYCVVCTYSNLDYKFFIIPIVLLLKLDFINKTKLVLLMTPCNLTILYVSLLCTLSLRLFNASRMVRPMIRCILQRTIEKFSLTVKLDWSVMQNRDIKLFSFVL